MTIRQASVDENSMVTLSLADVDRNSRSYSDMGYADIQLEYSSTGEEPFVGWIGTMDSR
jgi:hypothetical protein